MEGGNETRVIKFRRSRQQLPLKPDLLMILVWTVARMTVFHFPAPIGPPSASLSPGSDTFRSMVKATSFLCHWVRRLWEPDANLKFVLLGCNLFLPFHASHPGFFSDHQSYWLSDFRLNRWCCCSRLPQNSSPALHYNCVCMLECVVSHFSCVRLFGTPRTVALQDPVSMGLSRQDYWSALPCPPPGDLPDQGLNQCFFSLLHGRQVLYH